ncbi:MAG: TRAP transporter substrate-binding protein DctP [Pseudomonadota bacterium]
MRLLTGILALIALAVHGSATAETFKLATIAPENSQWMRDMRAGAKTIKERTDGRVIIKLYGGGVMGNDSKVLRKMRTGQLHGGAFTAGSLMAKYPELAIYGLPLMFESLEEVDFVRAKVDARLKAGLEDAGYVTFGFAGGGFAMVLGNAPVRNLEDLGDQKVWVPEGDTISYAGMQALNLAPVTLPITDVLTGLQTGLLDIIATPPVGALVFQWHTKVKYGTEVPLVYTLAYLAIDKKRFDRISADDQAVVNEVMGEIYANFDRINRVDNEKAVAALEQIGIEMVELDPGQLEQWRSAVQATNRRLAEEGEYPLEFFNEVSAMLEDYRSSNTADSTGTAASAVSASR